MFLRKTSRFKDGKVHDYWSVAENSRAGRRVVQRQLLYLGEIDEDRQNAWLNAISELDERKEVDERDCLQVVIALVLTPDGLPLAYEVMPGNTSDKGTQMQFVDRLVKNDL